MRKILNSPDSLVEEALEGFAAATPSVRVDLAARVVSRAEPARDKVGLVSGGGSGHEPMHSGFVGRGMLDAAACGEVFTSPVPDQILRATELADSGRGVLHLVKNYTGDVMNFELAAELAELTLPDTQIEQVVIDDDVAVEDSTHTAGRRGVGLTVIIEKIVGAAAEQGQSLAGCAALAREICAAGGSMGLALSSCTVPAVGHPTFDLPDGEIELGIGIHGEPGRERRPNSSARELAPLLADPICDDRAIKGPVILFLTGLGATPLLELYVLHKEIVARLERRGVTVARALVGEYMTSLDMAGASLTLAPARADWLELWDAPVDTPALRWGR